MRAVRRYAKSAASPNSPPDLFPNGEIPRKVQRIIATQAVNGLPSPRDEETSVGLRIFPTEAEQLHAQRRGIIRLLQLQVPSPVALRERTPSPTRRKSSSRRTRTALSTNSSATAPSRRSTTSCRTPPSHSHRIQQLYEHVRAELIETVFDVTKLVAEILSEATALKKAIKKATSLTTMHAVSDVKAQMENLVYPGFVAQTGYDQLVHLPRYLRPPRCA